MKTFHHSIIASALVGICLLTTSRGAESESDTAPTLEARLAVPFRDNAILQQKIQLPVWGTSLPGAKVTVSFEGQSRTTTADADGQWRVLLDPMTAVPLKSVNESPDGKTMTVVCEKDAVQATKEVRNLLVGDVWVCAGQSNMAGRIKSASSGKNHPSDTVAAANYPGLRFLNVEEQRWEVCTPETVLGCSRVAFFFARRLQQDALVPVGLVVRAVGGSKIESWLNREPYKVGNLYEKLMTPVVGYGIRGAIWYQGESNSKDGRDYQPKLKALIEGWREAWGLGDFPFHYVQLPGLGESTTDNPAMGDGRAEIRQTYFETLALPNTGMAVTLDIGKRGEHPPNKFDTGIRLARSVLQKVYGMDITACPLYRTHKVEGNTIRVSATDDAKGGLMIAQKAMTIPDGFQPPTPTPDAKLDWLSIKDADGKWHWADAKIDGAELLVSADGVANPVAVRYAYTAQPVGHLLYNTDGMPVGPFTTCGYDEQRQTGEK